MSIKHRIRKLEERTTPPQLPSIFIMLADGVTVDGKDLSVAEYQEQ